MRNVLVAALPALVIAQTWLHLERPERDGGRMLLLVALALVPALAPRWRQRLALLVPAAALACAVAVRAAPWDARPWDERHDFFGPFASRVGNGFLDFYDVKLPFDPYFHPQMHALLLLAAFGFAAALGLAAAARRPLACVLILLVGAGWPATLLPTKHDIARGGLILVCALLLLAGFRAGARQTLLRAGVAGAVLVLVAVAASTRPAVAKSSFLDWQHWDPYTRPDRAVGVRYVWDAHYDGFTFPRKRTVVLKVKAPPRSVYWRATTLDEFTGDRWVEDLRPASPELFDGKNDVTASDPMAGPGAFDSGKWTKAEFEVRAFRDDHVAAPSVPVAYGLDFNDAAYAVGGTVLVADGLARGHTYNTWSYLPDPTPARLALSEPAYPAEAATYLEIVPGVSMPAFGTGNRDALVERLFQYGPYAQYFNEHRAFYEKAREVVGRARSPYGATLAIETWLRRTGGFLYDQHPKSRSNDPLTDFVLHSKRGYCQHFAGAMALMLRYLGIPARVAEGFTSGKYDRDSKTWTVTDHDAHAWVEAWFLGYGWLPFDPTPGRGQLSVRYSASAPNFDAAITAALVRGAAARVLRQYTTRHHATDRDTLGGGFAAADPRRAGGTSAGGGGHRGGSLGKLLATALAAAVLLIALAKTARRRTRYATHDPRRLASACRGELVDFLADQGVRIAPSTAPAELVDELRERLEVDARPFAAALAQARYGPPDTAPRAAARARVELSDLQQQIRARVGLWRRVRGVVSLRSLGFAGT
jgi:transglutaminase-like putative cysteine protease